MAYLFTAGRSGGGAGPPKLNLAALRYEEEREVQQVAFRFKRKRDKVKEKRDRRKREFEEKKRAIELRLQRLNQRFPMPCLEVKDIDLSDSSAIENINDPDQIIR
ncbi:UNVERIFIED_CONTAM: hypothetical protein RMT77_003213 [Armadillidium vulgare]